MKIKDFIIKHGFIFQIVDTILGTAIMFYALYFSNKPASLITIKNDIYNPMLYICLVISFLGSWWISKIILPKKNKKP